MNTPSHILIGAAFFGRPSNPYVTLGALAGGLAPDIPMFVMVLWSTQVLGLPDQEVFGRLYFSAGWQAVFSIDHGFFVWSAMFAVAIWGGLAVLRAFAGAALLHAVADFLTHHDDARRQFWPLTEWVFRSPVSYWDPRHYGPAFAVLEFSVVILLSVFLCWRLRRTWERALVLTVAAPVVVSFVLTGSVHVLHGMG